MAGGCWCRAGGGVVGWWLVVQGRGGRVVGWWLLVQGRGEKGVVGWWLLVQGRGGGSWLVVAGDSWAPGGWLVSWLLVIAGQLVGWTCCSQDRKRR